MRATYIVGVPLVIEVSDDGAVSLDLDLSDLSVEISDPIVLDALERVAYSSHLDLPGGQSS